MGTDPKTGADVLDVLIATTQDAVVFIDARARIVRVNPAAEKVFGYEPAELLGAKVDVLMPEPYASAHDGYVAHYERTGEARAIGRIRSVSARRKSGEVFPIELSVTELPAGGDVRYAAFIRDVSERARLQAELVERERLAAIGTTAATFAHEIGNPLNGMFMNAQLVLRQLAAVPNTDAKLVERARRIVDQLKHMTGLLQEFRLLARRERLEFAHVDVNDVVREVLAASMAEREAVGVRTVIETPHAQVAADVDPAKLVQVVVNLVKNAVEAMQDGGTLTVRVEADVDQVQIDVRDDGCGMPADIDVFAPFTSTKEMGTGLGLAVVRRIVDAHGGSIAHRGEPEGGTTFSVILPRRRPPPEPPASGA
jgi:two-component system sensor kinase FixL